MIQDYQLGVGDLVKTMSTDGKTCLYGRIEEIKEDFYYIRIDPEYHYHADRIVRYANEVIFCRGPNYIDPWRGGAIG